MDERVTTLVIKDDITNFLLLYRKLVETSYSQIGVYTVYNSEQYRNVLNQDFIKLFPKMLYIGPTAMYEHYVEAARFPIFTDLEKYNKNLLNLDLLSHVMGYHLDEVFPKQKTCYQHGLQVDQEIFIEGTKCVNKDHYNLGLNLLDTRYDVDGVLHAELPPLLEKLKEQPKPVHIYVYGIVEAKDHQAYLNMLLEYLSGYEAIINCMEMPYSQQIGTMVGLDLLISGSYSWGILAYTMNIPTIMIYPFYMADMRGNISPKIPRDRYIELVDEEVSIVADEIMEKVLSWLE